MSNLQYIYHIGFWHLDNSSTLLAANKREIMYV